MRFCFGKWLQIFPFYQDVQTPGINTPGNRTDTPGNKIPGNNTDHFTIVGLETIYFEFQIMNSQYE